VTFAVSRFPLSVKNIMAWRGRGFLGSQTTFTEQR
jgi:hypothetical protein